MKDHGRRPGAGCGPWPDQTMLPWKYWSAVAGRLKIHGPQEAMVGRRVLGIETRVSFARDCFRSEIHFAEAEADAEWSSIGRSSVKTPRGSVVPMVAAKFSCRPWLSGRAREEVLLR